MVHPQASAGYGIQAAAAAAHDGVFSNVCWSATARSAAASEDIGDLGLHGVIEGLRVPVVDSLPAAALFRVIVTVVDSLLQAPWISVCGLETWEKWKQSEQREKERTDTE